MARLCDIITQEDKDYVLQGVAGLTAEHLEEQLQHLAAHLNSALSTGQTFMRQETLTIVWEATPATTNCLVGTVTANGLVLPDYNCLKAWILCLREIHGARTPMKANLHIVHTGEVVLYLLEPEREYSIYCALGSMFLNVVHGETRLYIDGLLPEERKYLWTLLAGPQILVLDIAPALLVTVAQFAMRGHARWEAETDRRRLGADAAGPVDVPVADVADMAAEVRAVLAKNIFGQEAAAAVLAALLRSKDRAIDSALELVQHAMAAAAAMDE